MFVVKKVGQSRDFSVFTFVATTWWCFARGIGSGGIGSVALAHGHATRARPWVTGVFRVLPSWVATRPETPTSTSTREFRARARQTARGSPVVDPWSLMFPQPANDVLKSFELKNLLTGNRAATSTSTLIRQIYIKRISKVLFSCDICLG
jgi:hypothetical protein